ncbi:VWA domain-containing protein [bacterium]|nr:VWA domain-containing protein [bacterium]MBU1983928.1 VWA domain-containing protein [bacterium]
MTFANPQMFWMLLVLPVMVYVHFWWENRRTSDFRYPTIAHAARSVKTWRIRFRHVPFLLRLVAVALLVVVLARPQLHDREIKRSVEGIDIILCLDTSTSMAAEDLTPNRLEAAKKVAAEFVEGRFSDRIGIVPFAAQSFTQCPLTTDYSIVVSLLEDLHMGMVEDGTAIGMALATALNRLRESDAKSKVVILLTDGQNNRGEIDPVTAAQAAQALGIRVYTIGVGTRGEAPYPVETVFGKRYQNIPVNIDEDMLNEIAKLSGGQYFRATDNRALRNIYAEIDRLERTRISVEEYRRVAEMFGPWLWAAILCMMLDVLFGAIVVRKSP